MGAEENGFGHSQTQARQEQPADAGDMEIDRFAE